MSRRIPPPPLSLTHLAQVNYSAGKTLRLTNFLLDTAAYFAFLIPCLLIFKNIIAVENVKWLSFILYFSYYFLFEYFIGQTLGKMLTKSRVVSTTANNSYFFIKIFIRTLTRLTPFDVFSYLRRPWFQTMC